MSLVYPADATPGHLLSVVPVQQLAMLHRRKQQKQDAEVKIANTKSRKVGPKTAPPSPEPNAVVVNPAPLRPASMRPTPVIPAVVPVARPGYGDVIRSQQQWLLQLQGR